MCSLIWYHQSGLAATDIPHVHPDFADFIKLYQVHFTSVLSILVAAFVSLQLLLQISQVLRGVTETVFVGLK